MLDIKALIARSIPGEVRLVKLVIAGSRSLEPSLDRIHDAVDALLEDDIVPCEIVSGCARGVDRAGEQWAASVGLPIRRFAITQRDWQTYGRSAGPRRNAEMARYAGALLAFWDGRSNGTRDMIDVMRRRGKPVRVMGG